MFFAKKRNNKILARNRIATGEIRNKVGNKHPRKFSRFLFFVLAVIFLGISVYVFLFSDFLKINKVEISGVDDLNYEDVLAYTQSLYGGKILKFIPKNNFLFVSAGKIDSSLLDRFKEIAQVETKKIFPNTLAVSIKERKSILLWCSAGPCYFIDENGIAYEGADMDSDEVKGQNLVELSDTSGTPVKIGEKIFDSGSVALISGIKNELKDDVDVDVSDEFETSSKMAEDFQAQTPDGTFLFFSLSSDLGQQIEMLKTFLDKEIKREDMGKLEYIDLRAEDKVYYKIKDGETINLQNQNQDQSPQNAPSNVQPENNPSKKNKG